MAKVNSMYWQRWWVFWIHALFNAKTNDNTHAHKLGIIRLIFIFAQNINKMHTKVGCLAQIHIVAYIPRVYPTLSQHLILFCSAFHSLTSKPLNSFNMFHLNSSIWWWNVTLHSTHLASTNFGWALMAYFFSILIYFLEILYFKTSWSMEWKKDKFQLSGSLV